MRKLTLPFFLLAFPALLAGTTTTAQQIVTTSSVPAFTNAVQQYNVALASQLPIYNGKEYIDYKQNFEVGQPYFLQKSWTIGTMVYENVQYAGVPIMYNLVTDEVIIPTPDTAAKIQLQKDRVQAFTVGGHLFAYVPANSVLHDAVRQGSTIYWLQAVRRYMFGERKIFRQACSVRSNTKFTAATTTI